MDDVCRNFLAPACEGRGEGWFNRRASIRRVSEDKESAAPPATRTFLAACSSSLVPMWFTRSTVSGSKSYVFQ